MYFNHGTCILKELHSHSQDNFVNRHIYIHTHFKHLVFLDAQGDSQNFVNISLHTSVSWLLVCLAMCTRWWLVIIWFPGCANILVCNEFLEVGSWDCLHVFISLGSRVEGKATPDMDNSSGTPDMCCEALGRKVCDETCHFVTFRCSQWWNQTWQQRTLLKELLCC